jgi:mannose-6-phosphate isomerase-like protein (cupin superfamily)
MSDLPEARTLKYVKPVIDGGKAFVKLCRTDRMVGYVQVIAQGGENNLHSHRHSDGLWFVLSGRVRFYGPERHVIGEFGRYEGVMVPRDCQYWFEAVGDEQAEILQVEAFDIAVPVNDKLGADIVNHAPKKEPKKAVSEAAPV